MTTVEHTIGFDLSWPVARVFPLFSPEGEKAWVPGWNYESPHGPVDLHEDYVFVTRDHDHAASEAIWLTKCYRPDRHLVQFYKIEPEEKVGVVTVQCRAVDRDTTHVQVTYKYMAISDAGKRFVESFDEATYAAYIGEWEQLLQAYFAASS